MESPHSPFCSSRRQTSSLPIASLKPAKYTTPLWFYSPDATSHYNTAFGFT